MRPLNLSEVVERERDEGDWRNHLDEFLDTFYGAHGDPIRQSSMIERKPRLLGDAQANAFIGGAGEHLARRWGLPVPVWVRDEGRYLDEAMFVPDRPAFRGYLVAVSPVSFRTRLIFTGPDPLQRARFPYTRNTTQVSVQVATGQ